MYNYERVHLLFAEVLFFIGKVDMRSVEKEESADGNLYVVSVAADCV